MGHCDASSNTEDKSDTYRIYQRLPQPGRECICCVRCLIDRHGRFLFIEESAVVCVDDSDGSGADYLKIYVL